MTIESNTPPNALHDDDEVVVSATDANGNPLVDPDPDAEVIDDDPEFANMTPRERKLVQKARSDEKQKLYKRLETQKQTLKDLRTELKAAKETPTQVPVAASGNNGEPVNNDVIARLELAIQKTNENILKMQENEVRRREHEELRRYRAERIAEVRDGGEDLIDGLVGGDTEEEIDNSIDVARAEYQYVLLREEEKKTRRTGGVPRHTSVQVNGSGRRPAGTPPVMTPNTVVTETNESIKDLTSDAAVRGGDYGKNRSRLIGGLKRGYKYVGNNQPA